MRASDYWQLFVETGAPELYLMYNNARKMETTHVYDDPSAGSAGHQLQ